MRSLVRFRCRVNKALSVAALASAGLVCTTAVSGGGPLPTTIDDFFQRGTQPQTGGGSFDLMVTAAQCFFCHSNYDPVVEPYEPWAASMMGQAARDPMFWACLAIANQDAAESGEFCIRCHIPNAFIENRSIPTDGSALIPQDFESVNCNFCHRLVNPEYPVPGDGPATDEAILDELAAEDLIPPQGSNSRYIVDPTDSRRGPFDDIETNPHFPVEILVSPFHTTANFCWTCHDVSNPLLVRQPDDTYVLDEPLGSPHPTGDQFQEFPLHRTYSEWKNSYYFTLEGVQHNGRFGGNHINNPEFIADGTAGIMHVCHDCHMPDQVGTGCGLPGFLERQDGPQHSFIGANTWGLKAIRAVDADGDGFPDFPDSTTGLSEQSVADAIARNVDMLEKASDMLLNQVGDELRVRIINKSGHKLPTGFPDGRQMWINVKFFDAEGNLPVEHGEFDFAQGSIVDPGNTKVYEIKLGLDAAMAAITGLPEGETFHFMLANTIAKDNRIPSIGFSNLIAEQDQTAPVGATYLDGQSWDDTSFAIPGCAAEAVVILYYQLVSREYIDFLQDTNDTNNRGDVAFALWDDPAVGNRSAPVVMDMESLQFSNPADLDEDGVVGITDLLELLAAWGPCPPKGPCPADLDCDGEVGITDFLLLLSLWG